MALTTDPTYGRSHYQRLSRLVHLLSYVFNSSTILLPNAPFRVYWDVLLVQIFLPPPPLLLPLLPPPPPPPLLLLLLPP